jgi:hypothetical protein
MSDGVYAAVKIVFVAVLAAVLAGDLVFVYVLARELAR